MTSPVISVVIPVYKTKNCLHELYEQMNEADRITSERLEIWQRYHGALQNAENTGRIRRPIIPPERKHNAHMYYLLLDNLADRTHFIESLKKLGVSSVFHYVPLHSSPKGLTCSKTFGRLPTTTSLADRLVRLPLWVGLMPEMDSLVEKIQNALN
jgi:dTDP-4-amino-4,6-dideoxygalactose transaminase